MLVYGGSSIYGKYINQLYIYEAIFAHLRLIDIHVGSIFVVSINGP